MNTILKLIIALGVVLSASAAIPPSERAVLVNLYNSTAGSGWTNKTNWNGAAGTECTWHGVICNPSKTNVTEITLAGNNLTGQLPSLSGLPYLENLSVQVNQLSGSLPSFAGLSRLRFVAVGANKLTGPIPSLDGLTSLEQFWCDYNNLTSLPTFSGPSSLQVFNAEHNKLAGSIPSLSGLTSLRMFIVNNNLLSGALPPLQGLLGLEVLYVQQNELTGSIPDLTGLNKLIGFQVWGNRLTGLVPTAPPSLQASASRLCPNYLTHTESAAWDIATNNVPPLNTHWYTACVVPTTTTIILITPEPSFIDQPYTVTYTVTVPDGAPAPTGNVLVSENSMNTTSCSISAGHCALVPTTEGSKSIKVQFVGDDVFVGSSDYKNHAVYAPTNVATTTTINSISPSPSAAGQAYLVTVSVSSSFRVPIGSVTVSDGMNSCQAALSSGSMSCSLQSVTVGTKTITANYLGNTTYSPSSGQREL